MSIARTALLTVICTLAPIGFACYTQARAEDAYISLRHSRNLALGQGLTYEVGERIQGFSSPAAALIAAAGFAAFGSDAVGAAIAALQIVNVTCFALAVFASVASVQHWTSRRWTPLIAAALLALETKTIVFSINGMETGIVVGLMAVSAWALWVTRASARCLGACFGALLWTRPDGLVYLALMATATVIWPPARSEGRQAEIVRLVRSAGWTTLAYVPWLMIAKLSYGSVVPQSIVAKSARIGGFDVSALAEKTVAVPQMWTALWLPPYAAYGGWRWLWPCAFILGAAGTLAWILPHAPAAVRRSGVVAFGGTIYLALLAGTTPWYLPAIVPFSLPGIAWMFESLAATDLPAFRRLTFAAATYVIGCLAVAFAGYAIEARVEQANERINRQAIGLWLRDRVLPSQRVYLEGPGFIGFYSNRRMLDYPGVVAPDVAAVVRRHGLSMAASVRILKPEWMVLRPSEAEEIFADEINRPYYRKILTFDTRDRLPRAGRASPIVMSNALFEVFQRTR